MPAQSRAYHDTGVSGALPKKHYVSSKGFKVGKRPVVRKVERDDAPTSVDDDADDDDPPMSALEEFLLFVEEDFWMLLRQAHAFSLIAFLHRGRVQVARLAAQAVDENNRRVRALDRRDDDVPHRPAARQSRTLAV